MTGRKSQVTLIQKERLIIYKYAHNQDNNVVQSGED